MRAWVLVVVSMACGGTPDARETTPVRATDDLNGLRAQWAARGVEVVREGDAFLEPSGRWTLPVQLGPECTMVFAVSSTGIGDLDAVLYSPEGDVLAEDVEPDAHPLLRYCGPARRAYYVAHAYAGAGTFRFVVARGTRADMDAVAESVGGAPPIGGSPTAALERTLRERGFERVVDRRRIQMVEGEDIRFPIRLRAHECVTVLARADSEVVLALETEAGRIDESAGETNGVQVCDVREAVGVLRGRGLAEVLVLAGPASDVGGPSALWMGAPRAAHIDAEGEPWTLDPAEARELSTEACRIFEATVTDGTAELTLRSGARELARGRRVRGEVCGSGVLITNAPARVRWRWIVPGSE